MYFYTNINMLFHVRDGRQKDGGRRADDFMLHAWTMRKGTTSCRVPRDARRGGEGGALKGAATPGRCAKGWGVTSH
jgi:hypothetical protein